MQKWKVTFVDDHGEILDEVFEREECPSDDEAARLIKERLLPVAAKLDLNDLEGRTADAGGLRVCTSGGMRVGPFLRAGGRASGGGGQLPHVTKQLMKLTACLVLMG